MSLYTARTIGGGTDAIGTTLPTFRHGLTGPTFYTGSADPTVTPPTPMDDGFHDGDIYIRGTAGGSALWVYDTAVWTQIASGAGGGSFAGDIIMVAGAQLLGDPAATAAAPAFAFNGDEDTGVFQVGANELGFSTGGTQALIIESDGTLASTTVSYEALVLADNDIPNRKYVEDTFVNISGDGMTGDLAFGPGTQLLIASGSAADPGIAFALDLDNGFYLDGADSIGVSAGGAEIANFDSVGIRMRNNAQFVGDDGVVGAPSIAFNSDLDTGILHDGTIGEIALVMEGTERIRFDDTAVDGSLSWRGGDGSDGDPAISFSSDPDTGFYLSGTGAITFNSDAVNACVISGAGVATVSGSAALPAFAFVSELSTGMFRPASNELGFATAGVSRWRINVSGDLLPTFSGADIATSGTRLDVVYATTFDGTATAAQYSDLAERYSVGDCDLVAGDVVIICDHEDHDICYAHGENDDRVLGVVSTKPAFMMNKDAGDDRTAPYIALRGRVPVNVYGSVSKGDLLVTSDFDGCARALTDDEKKTVSPHAVFAKALSSHSGGSFGEVEAVIL